MEFKEKLQQLRKQKNLTQEELAESIFVSRAAVSKWESGRGYPSIDSLKSISKVFTVSIDDLLSNEQLIAIAEDDTKEKVIGLRCVLYGLLDMMGLIFLFVPLFAQVNGDMVQSVSLLKLSLIETSLIRVYIMIICTSVIYGIIEIVLQNYENIFWKKYSPFLSHLITIVATMIFMVTQQPYMALFMFWILILKGVFYQKKV